MVEGRVGLRRRPAKCDEVGTSGRRAGSKSCSTSHARGMTAHTPCQCNRGGLKIPDEQSPACDWSVPPWLVQHVPPPTSAPLVRSSLHS